MVKSSASCYFAGRLIRDPDKLVDEATFIPIGRSATCPTISSNHKIGLPTILWDSPMRCLIAISALLCLSPGKLHSQTEDPDVTFAEHVAPIIFNNCIVCHRPDGVAPFSLLEYESVKRRAQQISEVVSSRYMPPWKPDPHFGPKFQGERRLSEEEIAIIAAWHESGAPSGDLAKAPPSPSFPNTWQLGEPDLILEFPETYQLPADGTDIYRNFAIPVSLESRKYVRAIEFLPRSQLVIHHALIQVDKSTSSREKDTSEPGPGFDGMGIGAAAPPEGQLVGWTPGQAPFQSHPETAWTLDPGSDIVVQLHMVPSGKVEPVSPRIGLYFTETAPTRSSFVMQMREFEIDIHPGDADYRIEERLSIPVDSKIIGLYPHAHYIGKDLGAYALFPDGTKHWLFRIPDWDFNWQGDYRYETPLEIPAGSTLHMSYTYDNSSGNIRNPNDPPRRIQGGWSSADEMAELSIQIMPVEERNFEKLKSAQARYEIDSAGGRARYAYNLGNYFELQGLLEKAGEHYYDAVQDDPAFASAHYKLGHVLERLGSLQGAEDRYRTALALRPELIPANIGLARIHYQNRAEFLAIELLDQVLQWEPQNYDARVYLARIQQTYSSPEKARQTLEAGKEFHENNPYFRLEMGKLDQLIGEDQAAIEHFKFAVENKLQFSKTLSNQDSNSLKSEALRSIAEISLKNGDIQTAQDYLEKAIETMPHNFTALLDAAKIAFDLSDKKQSIKYLRQIAALPKEIRPPKEYIQDAISSTGWRAMINEAYSD